jgi:hypothetical protein
VLLLQAQTIHHVATSNLQRAQPALLLHPNTLRNLGGSEEELAQRLDHDELWAGTTLRMTVSRRDHLHLALVCARQLGAATRAKKHAAVILMHDSQDFLH